MPLDSPHDALVKEIFSKPEFAAVELRAVLPPALVEKLDFATLRLEPSSFVEVGERDRHADLLYSMELKEREGRAFVSILFEHQSTPDTFMALRLLGYMVRLWERFRAEFPEKTKLPVIVPVVLYHGESRWTKATSFQELFVPELLDGLALRELTPSFRFVLDDLSRASDEELLRRAEREAEKVVSVVLWALRDARRGDRFMASLSAYLTALSVAHHAQSGKDALYAVFSYLARVAENLTPDAILAAVEAASPETKETVMTLAEIWLQQGIEKGLETGLAKGLEKGRAEGLERGLGLGQRALLRKLLTLKFGHLDEVAFRRLESATLSDLELWGERILSATTLEEVLGE